MTHLTVGDAFPDIQLPNHNQRFRQVSGYTAPPEIGRRLGFKDGYPLIVIFYRGYFCPRDQQQFRMLVDFQDELNVNYCRMLSVAVQPSDVQAAFRAGLGANWDFLADVNREVVNQLGLLDRTEGEYADVARPYTFVLRPDLTIHSAYDGWYFVGRPTLEELRHDLREIMRGLSYYPYDVWDIDDVKQIRIPQTAWRDGIYDENLATETGIVHTFDIQSGNGMIQHNVTGDLIFFNFTSIPGEGYRTVRAGLQVRFEIVETATGLVARNILKLDN